jgi:hypothetical protein
MPREGTIAIAAAVFLAVAFFRFVRRQYSPAMARQPYFAEGPSRGVLLGLSGLGVAAASFGLMMALRLLEFMPMMMGGVALTMYLQAGRFRYFQRDYARVRHEPGKRYVSREVLWTAAPWLALTAALFVDAWLLPDQNFYVAVWVWAAASLWIVAFQYTPHILEDSSGGIIRHAPSLAEWSRDGLLAFAGTWLLVASDGLDTSDRVALLSAVLPPMIAIGAVLAWTFHDMDKARGF